MPSQSPTLNGGGWGIIFDSRYRFLAVSLKKCLSGDNYRRPSQLLLTRIVAATELYLLYMIVKLPYAVMDLEFAAMGSPWPLFYQNGGQSQYKKGHCKKNYSKYKREEPEEPE